MRSDLRITHEGDIKPIYLGVDPAGEGRDETIWVARDNFRMKILLKEKTSNDKSIALKTVMLLDYY